MSEIVELDEMIADLREAAGLLDDELGEYWSRLVELDDYMTYCPIHMPFVEAWKKEVNEQYQHLTKNFKIVEKEEERTVTYRELRHVDEL